MNNRKRLIIVFGLLFNIGCFSSNTKKFTNNTKEINKTIIEKNSTHEETILNKMGFDLQNDKIIIDLNKSTEFFSKMEKKINKKSKEIENKIRGIEGNLTKNSSVIITKDKVDIDLNKTKRLLDNLSTIFRNIVEDMNTSF